MKNIELLNICYEFINRFITVDTLVELLDNMDKTKLSIKEQKRINDLISKIKIITNNIPNEEDEYIKNEKENTKCIIEKLESIPKYEEFLNKKIDDLKETYNKERDSKERWSKVVECINENEYFNECFDSLTDYELLEFITQNISAPYPPQITEEKFQSLVKVGIDNDKREWLWRLAFNYEKSNFNFNSIIDYFIDVKDGYYLVELICAIGEYLNIDSIIDKLNDKELMEYLIRNKEIIEHHVTDKQIKKFIKKYKSI